MMGKKVLAAKSGRAACSCAAAGGGIGAKNAKDAKSFLTGLTGFTGLREASVKPAKTKPSGVAWIGDIPDGWEVRRLRYLATSFRKGAGITRADVIETGDISCIRYGDIYSKYKNDVAVIKCISKTNRHLISTPQRIFKGDILFSCTGELVDEIGKNITYMGDEECLAGGDIIIVSHNQDPVFLSYALNSYVQTQKSHDKAKLKVVHISTGDIKNLLIVLPPLPVQRAIAAYLDEKCGAIDVAVAEAKKGIEEYKAWKKSLIFEVVTGKRRVVFFNAESKCARDEVVGLPERSEPEGLQGAASRRVAEKMKSSGIPWIGDVPVGWEVSRVKHHYELILGKMLCATSNNDANVRLPYVCAANVHFEGVALSDLKEMWFSTIEVKQYAIREGDLLVVEGGAGAGGAAICPRIDGIVGIQNSIILVRNKSCRDNRYLRYLLEALVKNGYVDFVCNKATIPHFTKDKLGNVPLPLPPLPEQQAIAAYLDEKCGAIDEMVAEKEALIADLEAYKKSLIYETVTGKREVL